MKKLLLLLSIFINATCSVAKQSNIIKIEDISERKKYYNSDYSSKIKFDIEDYIGAWRDASVYSYDFKLNNDLTFEFGEYVKGKCEKVEQKNNILLLKCLGNFLPNKEDLFEYIKLQLFYFPIIGSKNSELQLTMNISMDHDKECALADINDRKEKCNNKYHQPDRHLDMYYEIDKELFNNYD